MGTLVNPLCTLADLKAWVIQASTYNASTISFDQATKQIRDTTGGLKRFISGMRIQVSGSASNNGYYTVATGGLVSPITVNEALVNEVVGASVTISDVTDVTDDDNLIRAINTASRNIEIYCGRIFYATNQTRYYDTDFDDLVFTDDIISITTLKTDTDSDGVYETTWQTSDYILLPRDAANEIPPGSYRRIQRAPNGSYYFPKMADAIQVVGSFGYAAIPSAVNSAALIHAFECFKRKDQPNMIAGQTEYGAIRKKAGMDADAMMYLAPFIKDVP